MTNQAQREHRRMLVARYLQVGLTIRQIQDRLRTGSNITVSRGTVGSDAQAIRKQWREQAAASYDDHVAERLAVLRVLREQATAIAMEKGTLWAMDRVIRMIEVENRMLGLDAPTRHEIVTQTELDRELKRLTESMPDEAPDVLRRVGLDR